MKECMRQLGKATCWFILYYAVSNAAAFLPMMALGGVVGVVGGSGGDVSAYISAAYSDIVYLSNILALPLFLFFVFVVARCREKHLRDELNLSFVTPWKLLFPLLLGVSLQPFVSILLSLLPINESVWDEFNQTVGGLDDRSVFGIIATVLIAPLMEETVLRGLVFERLRRGMPAVAALIFQALVFGVLHGNWIQGTYAFFLGIVMGLIYLKYDSLWASVLFHLGFNAASYYIYFIGDIGNYVLFALFAGSAACALALAIVIGFLKIKKSGTPSPDVFRGQESVWVS